MGELFSEYYPVFWLSHILRSCGSNPKHTFLILTKNLPRDKKIYFPSNVWLGATLNSFNDWARGYFLRESSAKVKFISFEPLLGKVFGASYSLPLDGINWIIIGAQTKPYKPPQREWVETIMDEADKLSIPVFLKNNLKPLMGGKLRQEFAE